MASLDFRADIKLANQLAAAIDAAVLDQAEDGLRPHLGASLIGRQCERQLWYIFRWAKKADHHPRMLRLFDRGQREEAQFIRLLRMAGVDVFDIDHNTGRQFTFSDIGGHFGGSLDAGCKNVPDAPNAFHVVEMKTHGKKSFDELEKKGVAEAKPEHMSQVQCYMLWTGMKRALYMAVCKDDDRLHLERIDFDADRANALIAKAKRIIESQDPPARLSDDSTYYLCKWCDYASICHQTDLPKPTCRSCCHSTPEMDGNGRWSCSRHQKDLATDEQKEACAGHVYLPSLLSNFASVMDASLPENWVEYEHQKTKASFRNGLQGGGFLSEELYACEDKELLSDSTVQELRAKLDGRLVA